MNTPFYETIHTPLTRQYNLGFQYEFLPQWVLEVGYVGSSGINQANYNHNYNLAQLASPSNPINGVTTNTSANAVYRVPYLGYQPIGMQGTEYDAGYHYNSLQATVRKQFSHGLTMQGAFTWSKDLTNLQECGPTGCIGDGQTNSNLATNLAQQQGPAADLAPAALRYELQLPTAIRTPARRARQACQWLVAVGNNHLAERHPAHVYQYERWDGLLWRR